MEKTPARRMLLETRTNDVLERVSDAFVALDREWRYTCVSARAAELFGWGRENITGKHIWSECPDGVGQPFQPAYERAMADRMPTQPEA